MPRKYDIAHLQKLLLTEHRVKRAYERAIDDFARIYDWMEQPQSEDETLEFDKQPLLKPQVQKIMNRLQKGVNVAVVDGVKTGWNLAQEKNDNLTRKVFGRAKGKKLSEEQLRAYFTRNEDGLQEFLSRKHQGLSLSERVWKLTAPFKEEMEMAIELAMREGRSADEMSRDVREYLKHPDMLFRRVKNRNGRLKLSKRAAAYHPGRGVYRSSYKNARRLAATEGNIAYRTADHERWQTLDFVVGFEVRLSNNHTCLNGQGKPERFHDMCDDLQGKYPKQFKFTGWHPHCRCFAIPILKTEEEMARDTERILDGEEPLPESQNAVQEMPDNFTTWINNNAARIADAHDKLARGERASIPFFLKDNFKDGRPENGYIWHEEKKSQQIRKGTLITYEELPPFPKHVQAFGEDGKATQEYKEYRKKLQVLAKAKFGGTEVENQLRIAISNKGIKEFINQPHKEAQAKNEVVRYLPQFIRECKYQGHTDDYKGKNGIAKIHVFGARIKEAESFVLVRELINGKCLLHSITSETEKIKEALKRE